MSDTASEIHSQGDARCGVKTPQDKGADEAPDSTKSLRDRILESGSQARGWTQKIGRRWRSAFSVPAEKMTSSGSLQGVSIANSELRRRMDQVAGIFFTAFNAALVEEDFAALMEAVERIPSDQRFPAVEGMAAGAVAADALMFGGDRFRACMAAAGAKYPAFMHLGAGLGLAKAPWRRSAVLKHCDPVHRPLVFDGIGFMDTLFKTKRVLRGWRSVRGGFPAQMYDQGVGRALWFVVGGTVDRFATTVRTFDESRHAALWTGLGVPLSCTDTTSTNELSMATHAAGPHLAHLAAGAAFAAAEHSKFGSVAPHTALAVAMFAGTDAEGAKQLIGQIREQLPAESSEVPLYETWRRDVQTALGRMLSSRGRG